jgi:hypothetical protein
MVYPQHLRLNPVIHRGEWQENVFYSDILSGRREYNEKKHAESAKNAIKPRPKSDSPIPPVTNDDDDPTPA